MINVTCAIIFKQNKVLITQRGEHPHHPFQWEFPGGKIKSGETEEQCIQREIKEELEIELEIIEKMMPVEFDYGFKKIRLVPFLCFLKSGEVKLNEHVDYRWIDWQELAKMTVSEADVKLLSQTENRRLLEKYARKQVNNT